MGEPRHGVLSRWRSRYAFAVTAGLAVLSILVVVSPAPAQSPAMLVTSTLPTRTSDNWYRVEAIVASDCVTDPVSVRTCGPIELRLTYYYRNEFNRFARWDDVVQVEPPLSQPITFTIRPTAYSYKLRAKQEVCGPMGCSWRVAMDPPNGGSYPLPRV